MSDASQGAGMRCWACGSRCLAEHELTGPSDPPVGSERCSVARYLPAVVLDVHDYGSDCFAALVCWKCFHEIEPDCWIDSKIWASRNPIVPYDKLPAYDHDDPNRELPEKYRRILP